MQKILLFILLFLFIKVNAQKITNEIDNTLLLDLFQNQRFNEAADYLKTVYPEPITDKKILTRFGYSLKMAGKLTEAEKYYARILEQDSTELPILFSMAHISQQKGNYQKATEYYKKIIEIDSANFSVYKQLSNMIEVSDGLVLAAPYLAKANKLNPADGDVAYDFSKVLKSQKQFKPAEAVLDVAIAADSTNLILLRGKAELAYAMDNWPVVVASCSKIIKEGDQSAPILKMLGTAYFFTKKYLMAIEVLDEMEKNEMQNESILYYIAMSYKELKNYPKAIEYFNKTLEESISPNVANYYVQIGDSYEKNSSFKKALSAYQKSLQFEKKPMTYYVLANIYDQQLKDEVSALKYYRKYLNAKPSFETSKTYIEYTTARIEELSR